MHKDWEELMIFVCTLAACILETLFFNCVMYQSKSDKREFWWGTLWWKHGPEVGISFSGSTRRHGVTRKTSTNDFKMGNPGRRSLNRSLWYHCGWGWKCMCEIIVNQSADITVVRSQSKMARKRLRIVACWFKILVHCPVRPKLTWSWNSLGKLLQCLSKVFCCCD